MPNSRATDVDTASMAAAPAGVSGRYTPWATLTLKKTRGPPRPSGTGYSVVIGRAWVIQKLPWASSAHSMSWGAA